MAAAQKTAATSITARGCRRGCAGGICGRTHRINDLAVALWCHASKLCVHGLLSAVSVVWSVCDWGRRRQKAVCSANKPVPRAHAASLACLAGTPFTCYLSCASTAYSCYVISCTIVTLPAYTTHRNDGSDQHLCPQEMLVQWQQ